MSHIPFIVGAYAITFVALGGLLAATAIRMRRAEKSLDDR